MAPPHNLEFRYFNNERIKRSLFHLGRVDSTRERRFCSMSRHEKGGTVGVFGTIVYECDSHETLGAGA